MILETSLEQFLEQLSSSAPTPGGGSAAAAIGATGAALLSMVANVTLGKKGMEEAAPQMRSAVAETERLRHQLMAMIAQDIAAFDGLMRAYRLSKVTAEDKTRRAAAIQQSLQAATQTPLDCAALCADVIKLARAVAEHGYNGVISDAGVGVLAAHTALRSAALNVQINVPQLQDRAFAARAALALDTLLEFGGRESEAVFALVRSRLQ